MKTLAVCLSLLSLCAAPALAQELAPVPLSLRDVLARAIENNLDIAVTRVDPQISEQDVIIAEAAFDPRIEAQANYGKTKEEPGTAVGSETTETRFLSASWVDPLQWGGQYEIGWTYNENIAPGSIFRFLPDIYTSGLTARYQQSLLRNFGIAINRTSIEQAMNARRISEEELIRQALDTVVAAESGYWNLVGARRQLEVARASLDLAKDFLRQTKIKVEVGTLPPIEITTADAEVASREEGVIVAENAVNDAEDFIREILAVPADSPDWNRPIRPLDEPGFSPVPVNVDEAIAVALKRRPELAATELQVRNLELTERFRANQLKPDLSLQLEYGLTGNNFDSDDFTVLPGADGIPGTADDVIIYNNQGRGEAFSELPSNDNNSWSVGAVFSYPIGNRAAKAQHARSRLAITQANLQLDAARQAVRVDVREAVRNLETAARRVATTRANVVLQRKKLEAEQKRYENGLSTAFQVLTFQTDLRDAESREITAIVDYNQAVAELGRAQGTLLDQRGVQMR